jgi:hypothetical protein
MADEGYPPTFGRALRRVCLALPFVSPFVVHALYQPINERWTVKQFGCGCPPLDGSWRFNANHFNTILWAGVALSATVAWGIALRPEFPARGPSAYPPILMAGIGLLLWICAGRWAKEIWL